MTVAYGGVHDSKTQIHEHVEVGDVGAKRVLLAGYDGTNLNDVNIDSEGNVSMQIRPQNYPYIDSDGGINWTSITPTFNATSDVYQFYLDGVLKKTITINYTDATKAVMSGVTKA